jgi:prepilin-type N-terminal cleavage/methylation domain-containing protein
MDISSHAYSRGYSLAELVFTIALIGILAALAVPSMSGWIRKARTTRMINQLTADLHYARMLAAQAGQRVEVRFTPAAANSCITKYEIFVDGAAQQRRAKLVAVDEEVPGVCLSQSRNTPVLYNSRGMLATVSSRRFRAVHGAVGDSVVMAQGGRLYRID